MQRLGVARHRAGPVDEPSRKPQPRLVDLADLGSRNGYLVGDSVNFVARTSRHLVYETRENKTRLGYSVPVEAVAVVASLVESVHSNQDDHEDQGQKTGVYRSEHLTRV
jgi:hypothetical protein